jgi:hypothetical protein
MNAHDFKAVLGITGIFATLLFPLALMSAAAHLDAGSDDVVNGYLIDFGYSPKSIALGGPVYLNYNLLDNKTGDVVNFTSAWIRISQGSTIVYSGTLHPNQGNINMQLILPSSGTFEVLARFFDGDAVLVEKTDILSVASESSKASYSAMAYGAMFIFLGAIILLILFAMARKRSLSKSHKHAVRSQQ